MSNEEKQNRKALTVEEIIRVQQPRHFVPLKPEYIEIEDDDYYDWAYTITLPVGEGKVLLSGYDSDHIQIMSIHA